MPDVDITVVAATQVLAQLQHILHASDGLHAVAWKMKAHPHLVGPNFSAQHATQMRQALAQRQALQQFLPASAANDGPALPPAAA